MSEQTFTLNALTVVIPDAHEKPMSWQAIGENAESLVAVGKFERGVSVAIAPHYLVRAQEIEKAIRDNPAEFNASGGDSEIRERCVEQYKAKIAEILKVLKDKHGWEGNKLPGPHDSALRKVRNVWKNGGWTLDQVSVAGCEKFNREASERIRKKLDQATGQETVSTDVDDFGFAPPELKEELATFLKNVEAAHHKNGKALLEFIRAQNAKLARMAGIELVQKAANG